MDRFNEIAERLVFVVFIVIATVGVCLYKDDSWREHLVKQGHAEYYLDANHARQWRMKECD